MRINNTKTGEHLILKSVNGDTVTMLSYENDTTDINNKFEFFNINGLHQTIMSMFIID